MKTILMSEFTITASNEHISDIKERFIDEHLQKLLDNKVELKRDLDYNQFTAWTVNLYDLYIEAVAENHVIKALMTNDLSALKEEVKRLAVDALGEWFDDATS